MKHITKCTAYTWFLWLIIFAAPLMAQTPQESFELDYQHSGAYNYNYKARDYIVLSEGFSFAPTTGSFTAQIDETVICPPKYGTVVNDPESPDYPLKRELNTSNDVGNIAGSFSVSPSGGATYTVPINIPPGIAGMEPGISVVYNSQGTDGVMGKGWNLSAISSISRSGRSIYFDEITSGILFINSDDRLSLDGQRLIGITSGETGLDALEFKTESESFLTITREVISYSDFWFKVETQDGKIMEYGREDNAKYEADDKVLAWMLNKVVDKKGNYIKYYYNKDAENGEITLKKIEYGGNGTQNVEPTCEVLFGYNKRGDPWEGKIRHETVSQTLLLAQITTYAEGQLSGKYKFNYTDQDNVSCLYEIIRENGSGGQLNSTVFTWDKPEFDGNYTTTSMNVASGDDYYPGDFNGDGFGDILTLNFYDCKLNSGTSSGLVQGNFRNLARSGFHENWYEYAFINCSGFETSLVPTNIDNLPDVKFKKIGDFDGDGQMELLELIEEYMWEQSDQDNVCSYLQTVSEYNPFNIGLLRSNLRLEHYKGIIFGYNGDNLVEERAFTTDVLPSAGTVDFNQDGKTDIIIGDTVYNLDLATNDLISIGTTNDASKFNQAYWGDLNADGRLDFVTRSGYAYLWDYFMNDFSLGSYGEDVTAIGVVDTDGDGWSELLLVGPDEWEDDIYIGRELYTRNWNFDKIKSFGYYTSGMTTPNHSRILDMNGDGRADIALLRDNNLFEIYYSTGRSGYTKKTMNVNVGYNVFAQDYNGDGIDEIGAVGYSRYIFGTGLHGYLINAFIDGLNQQTTVDYKPLTDNSAYTKSSNGLHPLTTINTPMYVVSSVLGKDYNGNETTTTYTYNDGILHMNGKGFLGFSKMTVDNNKTGKTVMEYEIEPDFYVPQLSETNTFAKDGTHVSSTTYTYTIEDMGDRKYFKGVHTITENDLIHGNTRETVNLYNVSHYLSSSEVDVNSGESGIETTFNNYNNFGEPQTITKTYSRSGESDIMETINLTYDGDGYLLTRQERGVTKTYTYDGFGNIHTETFSGSGVESRTTTLEYGDNGRFVVESYNPLNDPMRMINDSWGNVVTNTDPNGLKTTYAYDGWRHLKSTVTPDSKTITTDLKWAGGGDAPEDAVYYTDTYKDGVFYGATYYDGLNRKVREVTVGYGGTLFYSDMAYNTEYELVSVTEPYPKADPSGKKTTTYTYYDDGRKQVETLPTSVTITYTYSGNTVTRTYNTGEVYKKTVDGAGLVISSEDPGGTIIYNYFSDSKTKSIESPTSTISMTYDANRHQETLNDPDAGEIEYDYNVFGELLSQTDNRNKEVTMTYDKLGRIKTKTAGTETTTYYYDENGRKGTLSRIVRDGVTESSFEYDGLIRTTKETRANSSESFAYEYEYNSDGNVSKLKYPNGFELTYLYNSWEDLYEIKHGATSVWKIENVNTKGELNLVKFGTKQVDYDYDTHGRPTRIYAASVVDFNYQYNSQNQLEHRDEKYYVGSIWKGFKEDFGYDGTNRLETVTVGTTEKLRMTYKTGDDNRIGTKSDVGAYGYDASAVHQVREITPTLASMPPEHILTYTHEGKTKTITENGTKTLTLDYGVDNQRFKAVYNDGTADVYTRYYFGPYEKEIPEGGGTRHLNYIYAYGMLVGIYEQKTSGDGLHYVYTDYLGSIRCITDDLGNVEERLSFDVWGNRRDYETGDKLLLPGLLTARGFTGHEHLDNFGLINMNGRVYDPLLGMFLNPDNYVQMPDYTQNFNRYSYALNNPMMYTDPDGEWFWLAVGAYFAVRQAMIAGVEASNNGGKFWSGFGKSLGFSAASMALGYGIGNIIGSFLPGVRTLTTEGAALLWGSVGGAATGGLTNGIMTHVTGGSFMEGFINGAVTSAIMGGIGGVQGYRNYQQYLSDRFWTLRGGGDRYADVGGNYSFISYASSGGGITVENSDGIPWTGDDVRISYNDNGGINNVRFVNDDGTGIIYFSDRITTYNVSMDFYGRHNYSSYFENKMGYIRGYRGSFGDHMMSLLKGFGGGMPQFHGAFDGGRMSWMAGWQQGRMDSKAGLSRRLFIEYWPNNQIKIHR